MSAAPEVALGLLRTAGLDLALPLAVLREVVPCPDELGDLPASAVGLLGVMDLRGTLLPVVDLAHVLERPHGRDRGQVVVVVASEGQVVGLLVDEIRGMASVPATGLVEVACSGGGLLFSRTFADPDGGQVVSVLDAEALLSLPGVPVVRETPRSAAVEPGTAEVRARSRSLTLVRCGGFTLALDVAHVHSTIPSPALQPSPADGETCLGVTPVAGFDVAVVDVLALLGLGSLQGDALDCGLVLDLPAGQVVLGVGSMVGLRDVTEGHVVPLPAMASPCPDLLRTVADVEGVGACLLVDGERLLTLPAVVSLSRIATASEAGSGGSGGSGAARDVTAGPPHLSYAAGVPLATQLSQVVEVLAYPEDLVPTSGAGDVLGFTVHRGTAVPVLCLTGVLGRAREPYTASSRLLLVDVDGDPVAYAVAGLHAILPLTWTGPAPTRPGEGLRACPLVQLAGDDALLPLLDLHALTRRLRGTTAPQLPTPRTAELPAPAG